MPAPSSVSPARFYHRFNSFVSEVNLTTHASSPYSLVNTTKAYDGAPCREIVILDTTAGATLQVKTPQGDTETITTNAANGQSFVVSAIAITTSTTVSAVLVLW